jgi:hypothetical protein
MHKRACLDRADQRQARQERQGVAPVNPEQERARRARFHNETVQQLQAQGTSFASTVFAQTHAVPPWHPNLNAARRVLTLHGLRALAAVLVSPQDPRARQNGPAVAPIACHAHAHRLACVLMNAAARQSVHAGTRPTPVALGWVGVPWVAMALEQAAVVRWVPSGPRPQRRGAKARARTTESGAWVLAPDTCLPVHLMVLARGLWEACQTLALPAQPHVDTLPFLRSALDDLGQLAHARRNAALVSDGLMWLADALGRVRLGYTAEVHFPLRTSRHRFCLREHGSAHAPEWSMAYARFAILCLASGGDTLQPVPPSAVRSGDPLAEIPTRWERAADAHPAHLAMWEQALRMAALAGMEVPLAPSDATGPPGSIWAAAQRGAAHAVRLQSFRHLHFPAQVRGAGGTLPLQITLASPSDAHAPVVLACLRAAEKAELSTGGGVLWPNVRGRPVVQQSHLVLRTIVATVRAEVAAGAALDTSTFAGATSGLTTKGGAHPLLRPTLLLVRRREALAMVSLLQSPTTAVGALVVAGGAHCGGMFTPAGVHEQTQVDDLLQAGFTASDTPLVVVSMDHIGASWWHRLEALPWHRVIVVAGPVDEGSHPAHPGRPVPVIPHTGEMCPPLTGAAVRTCAADPAWTTAMDTSTRRMLHSALVHLVPGASCPLRRRCTWLVTLSGALPEWTLGSPWCSATLLRLLTHDGSLASLGAASVPSPRARQALLARMHVEQPAELVPLVAKTIPPVCHLVVEVSLSPNEAAVRTAGGGVAVSLFQAAASTHRTAARKRVRAYLRGVVAARAGLPLDHPHPTTSDYAALLQEAHDAVPCVDPAVEPRPSRLTQTTQHPTLPARTVGGDLGALARFLLTPGTSRSVGVTWVARASAKSSIMDAVCRWLHPVAVAAQMAHQLTRTVEALPDGTLQRLVVDSPPGLWTCVDFEAVVTTSVLGVAHGRPALLVAPAELHTPALPMGLPPTRSLLGGVVALVDAWLAVGDTTTRSPSVARGTHHPARRATIQAWVNFALDHALAVHQQTQVLAGAAIVLGQPTSNPNPSRAAGQIPGGVNQSREDASAKTHGSLLANQLAAEAARRLGGALGPDPTPISTSTPLTEPARSAHPAQPAQPAHPAQGSHPSANQPVPVSPTLSTGASVAANTHHVRVISGLVAGGLITVRWCDVLRTYGALAAVANTVASLTHVECALATLGMPSIHEVLNAQEDTPPTVLRRASAENRVHRWAREDMDAANSAAGAAFEATLPPDTTPGSALEVRMGLPQARRRSPNAIAPRSIPGRRTALREAVARAVWWITVAPETALGLLDRVPQTRFAVRDANRNGGVSADAARMRGVPLVAPRQHGHARTGAAKGTGAKHRRTLHAAWCISIHRVLLTVRAAGWPVRVSDSQVRLRSSVELLLRQVSECNEPVMQGRRAGMPCLAWGWTTTPRWTRLTAHLVHRLGRSALDDAPAANALLVACLARGVDSDTRRPLPINSTPTRRENMALAGARTGRVWPMLDWSWSPGEASAEAFVPWVDEPCNSARTVADLLGDTAVDWVPPLVFRDDLSVVLVAHDDTAAQVFLEICASLPSSVDIVLVGTLFHGVATGQDALHATTWSVESSAVGIDPQTQNALDRTTTRVVVLVAPSETNITRLDMAEIVFSRASRVLRVPDTQGIPPMLELAWLSRIAASQPVHIHTVRPRL